MTSGWRRTRGHAAQRQCSVFSSRSALLVDVLAGSVGQAIKWADTRDENNTCGGVTLTWAQTCCTVLLHAGGCALYCTSALS